MKLLAIIILLPLSMHLQAQENMKYNKLTPEEEQVILHKGTERPFTGLYTAHKENGTYTCKRCDAELFRSEDKFDSSCGWPSFDDEIPGAVKRVLDADGERTEILCANCGGHLGHVFSGEAFTDKNTRHCVNSISLNFQSEAGEPSTEKAIFASGCFWGTEYQLQKLDGVLSTTVGYTGGRTKAPSYQEVCSGTSGHIEAVEVEFDPAIVSYEMLGRVFFETHDPEQTNGQGPDIGEQYLSYIFYFDDKQKKTAQKLITLLEEKGYKVATQLRPVETFWPAEDYHQDYYINKGSTPYCHFYTKRF